MALRLLAVDLPPLVRDLIGKALLRRDAEGVFVDLPASGGDLHALAVAAQADAVVAPLGRQGWPDYCSRIIGHGNGPPLFGLNCDEGGGRISELRAVEIRRTDLPIEALTIDEFVDAAGRAAEGRAP